MITYAGRIFGSPVPFGDFDPEGSALLEFIKQKVSVVAGENIAIHCHAGIGRTGLFAAFLARQALGLSGEEAIEWVRNFIPGAREIGSQRRMILDDDAR